MDEVEILDPGVFAKKKRNRTKPNKEPIYDATLQCGCTIRFKIAPEKDEELFCFRHPNRYQTVTNVTRVTARQQPLPL